MERSNYSQNIPTNTPQKRKEPEPSSSPSTATYSAPPQKKLMASTTISSEPVRYTQPDPVPSYMAALPTVDIRHAHNQAYDLLASTPAVLVERYHAEMGKSYQDAMKQLDRNKSAPKYVFPHMAPNKGAAPAAPAAPTKKFVRKAGGEQWEDPSLMEWDDEDHRIFVGDLGNETNDEILARAFGRYPSFRKARVIRDKRSGKTRGYGFVSFTDPNDFVKALKEMNGKYIGNRPCKLRKSSWKERNMEVPINFSVNGKKR